MHRSTCTGALALLLTAGLLTAALAAPARRPAGRRTAAPAAKPAAAPAGAVSYQREIIPLLQKYCSSCHGDKQAIGGINFQKFATEASVKAAHDIWEKVAHQVQSGVMPPRGLPQPSAAEKSRIIAWIQSTISTVDCDSKDPGRVTLRRLNRNEYNNTIRDLFGIDLKPADAFPSDDVGYGFDNIGDVLTISPLLMEKYMSAAEKVADAVILAPESRRPVRRYEAEAIQTEVPSGILPGGFRMLYGNGELSVEHQFRAAGEYLIRARIYGERGGPELPRLAIMLDGRRLKEQEVTARSEDPALVEVRVNTTAGPHRAGIAFLNDFFMAGERKSREDRNLVIDWIEVEGPLSAQASQTDLPPSHRRIITSLPRGADWKTPGRKVIAGILPRIYRRPVAAPEVDRLLGYLELARKQGESYERGVQLALQAALVSPHFLFRVETGAAAPASAGKIPLNDYQLASRLSYFLWSSMPDERLFSLAAKGQLRRVDTLTAEAMRMLKDPKASALVTNFGGQWLHLRILDTIAPAKTEFPGFDEALRQAMKRETELFFSEIMRQDRPILDFLDADFTYLNERLAKHYGMDGVQGDQFRRVTLTDSRRGGVLTQGSVLTLTSNPTRTSPVKRGRWVLEQLLGTPPPPPPPDVPPLEEGKQAASQGTLRQRMEQHRVNPACAVCHEKMDALGFGLENFDATGAWRDREGENAIDSSGTLPGGKSFSGPAELKKILKAETAAFSRNFTQRLLIYALGRGLENYDRCSVDDMLKPVEQSGYRFSEIVRQVVLSEPFRFQTVDRKK